MVTIPRRGSLICISIVAETIWRMRTASRRARAGSAIGPPRNGQETSWVGVEGPVAGPPRGLARGGGGTGSSIGVAEQLPVGRQQRPLGPLGQQPLAGVEDVGHLGGLTRHGGDPDLRTAVQVGVA